MIMFWGFVLLLTSLCADVTAQTCSALPGDKSAALVEYVKKKYHLDEQTGLKIVKEQAVAGSCYRQLTFEGKSPVRTWQLNLFLSPDGQFLTSELFDTAVDPVEEERQRSQTVDGWSCAEHWLQQRLGCSASDDCGILRF